jgi:trehalose 6-phosphate synthase/phosphatase
MPKSRFIVVSNRLPVSVTKESGKLTYTVSSGGLATAMSSLNVSEQQLWIGWPGIDSEDLTENEKQEVIHELAKHGCVPVFLSRDDVRNFYEGYSNDTLWPLFHYFQSHTSYSELYWRSYKDVNTAYAKVVKKHAHKSSKIWVHDYHLMLLPAMIRKLFSEASIGFFLHIPFPSNEIYRLLPERKELLEGLLGADLIGFHIYDYARHFLSSCLRILGVNSHHGVVHYNGRDSKVDAFPIGIDYKKFRTTLKNDGVMQKAASLKDHYKQRKIILSVDRLDYSKGIIQRLDAYDLLLRENPEYHKKVVLVMVAVPSRTEVETYRNLRDSVEQAVSRINGTYGAVDWAPISYQFQNLPFEELVALYSQADVMLVTPLRDGMNLVAKEYIASLGDTGGVLVLSEMAGAIDELPEALSINPNDSRSITVAIKKALKMTKKEQLTRIRSMQKRISSYTVQEWGRDFLEQLEEVRSSELRANKKRLTNQGFQNIASAFTNAKNRLILLDYDGTLQDFTSSPKAQHAKPSKKVKNLLTTISEQPGTKLCIVSGRSKDALEQWFGDTRFCLVAEHGAWIKYDQEWTPIDSTFNKDKNALLPILQKYASRTVGAVIEEKDYSLVWHYRNVPTELAYIRTANLKREIQNTIGDSDVGVYSGNKILEIKLKEAHKGYAASELAALYPSEFILAVGDDYTDEDMFMGLPEEAYTVKVGAAETNARYTVPNVNKVLLLLQCIADANL